MENFKEITLKDINFDANKFFGDHFGVLAARNKVGNTNCLTIAWGTYGKLWNKPVMVAFIRPERYTYGFINESESFSISFFDEKYKKELLYLGTHSGRDEDKVKNVDFHYVNDGEVSYFKEANLIFILRKLYQDDLKKDKFVDKTIIDNVYGSNGNLHTFYIGEIVKILKR